MVNFNFGLGGDDTATTDDSTKTGQSDGSTTAVVEPPAEPPTAANPFAVTPEVATETPATAEPIPAATEASFNPFAANENSAESSPKTETQTTPVAATEAEVADMPPAVPMFDQTPAPVAETVPVEPTPTPVIETPTDPIITPTETVSPPPTFTEETTTDLTPNFVPAPETPAEPVIADATPTFTEDIAPTTEISAENSMGNTAAGDATVTDDTTPGIPNIFADDTTDSDDSDLDEDENWDDDDEEDEDDETATTATGDPVLTLGVLKTEIKDFIDGKKSKIEHYEEEIMELKNDIKNLREKIKAEEKSIKDKKAEFMNMFGEIQDLTEKFDTK